MRSIIDTELLLTTDHFYRKYLNCEKTINSSVIRTSRLVPESQTGRSGQNQSNWLVKGPNKISIVQSSMKPNPVRCPVDHLQPSHVHQSTSYLELQ